MRYKGGILCTQGAREQIFRKNSNRLTNQRPWGGALESSWNVDSDRGAGRWKSQSIRETRAVYFLPLDFFDQKWLKSMGNQREPIPYCTSFGPLPLNHKPFFISRLYLLRPKSLWKSKGNMFPGRMLLIRKDSIIKKYQNNSLTSVISQKSSYKSGTFLL